MFNTIFRNTVERLMGENAKLKIEREQIEIKQQQLANDLEDRKKQQETLSNKHQKSVAEHAEAVRGLKVNSVLTLCI